MLVDANVLIYAIDDSSPHHERARVWLSAQLDGPVRVGIPWASITAFIRLVTHPRVMTNPLPPHSAWDRVNDWLERDVVWTPVPTPRHAQIFGSLIVNHHLTGNLVADAHLAALAIEHGLVVYSADSDFARFPTLTWRNPLTA